MLVNAYADWDLGLTYDSKQPIDFYVDNQVRQYKDNGHIKILCLMEPMSILPDLQTWAVKNKDKFDYIWTYNPFVLAECDNAVLFEFGGCWIPKDYSFPVKEFSISTVIGPKMLTNGHKLRHTLWKHSKSINKPLRIFNSKYGGVSEELPTLGDTKEPMFNSQFHYAIENSILVNYFSEKIIDCFQTKTVPIYYGCPNIHEYFNTDGIIIVNGIEELIFKSNEMINENTYETMLPYIEENYEKSKHWANLSSRIDAKFKDIFG